MVERRRLLVCLERCLLDGASGEAVSAMEAMRLLARRGWQVAGLSTASMAGGHRPPTGDRVEALRGDADVLTVHHVAADGVAVRVVRVGSGGGGEGSRVQLMDEREALVRLAAWTLRSWRPDVVLLGGGATLCVELARRAETSRVPAALWLQRTASLSPALAGVSWCGVVASSRFLQRLCRERLNVSAELVYPVVSRDRVFSPLRRPMYVTFVSPTPQRGAGFFVTLAAELRRRRPDIPVQVVEGSGRVEVLDKACIEAGLGAWPSLGVRVIPRADNPRTFLATSRVLVVPAVAPVGQCRVVLEAMMNGVPVLASDRGALAELFPVSRTEGWHQGTFGGALLPVASRLTVDEASDVAGETEEGECGGETADRSPGAARTPLRVATRGEVSAWVQAIERLWDDETLYKTWSAAGPASAARFDAETMADRLDALLRGWARRPAPPAKTGGGSDVCDDPPGELEREAARLLSWPDASWLDASGPGRAEPGSGGCDAGDAR